MAWQVVLAQVGRALLARGAQAAAARTAATQAGRAAASTAGRSAAVRAGAKAAPTATAAGRGTASSSAARIKAALADGGSVLDALNSTGRPTRAPVKSDPSGIYNSLAKTLRQKGNVLDTITKLPNRAPPSGGGGGGQLPPLYHGPPSVPPGGGGGPGPPQKLPTPDWGKMFGGGYKMGKGVLQFVRALKDAYTELDNWTRHLVSSQREIGNLSARAIGGLMQLDIGRLNRQLEMAKATGGSIGRLARARNAFEDAIQPYREMSQEVLNDLAATVLENLAKLIKRTDKMVDYLKAIADWLPGVDFEDEDERPTPDLIDSWVKAGRLAAEDRAKRRRTL